MKTPAARPLGLKIIIVYKLAKAPLMLALAVWLTVAPRGAVHVAHAIARDLSEGGATLRAAGSWIEQHLTRKVVIGAAALAWLDAGTTALEGFLLWQGKVWGEWLVVAVLSAFVPFEALSLERHPSLLKLGVLTTNVAIVAYLVMLRLRTHRRG